MVRQLLSQVDTVLIVSGDEEPGQIVFGKLQVVEMDDGHGMATIRPTVIVTSTITFVETIVGSHSVSQCPE